MAGDFNDVISTVNVIFNSVGRERVQQDVRQVMATMQRAQKSWANLTTATQNDIAITTKKGVKGMQAYGRELSQALEPTAKSFSEAARHMAMLNSALKTGSGVGRSSVLTFANMSKGANTFYTVAQKPLSRLQQMRVQFDAIGQQINAVGLRWQSTAKNMQWTGRQMMVGLTLPIMAGAGIAIKQWQSVNQELTRVKKVMTDFEGTWGENTKGINKAKYAQEELLSAARELGHEYAAVDSIVLATMGDFAAMGYENKKVLKGITELSLRTSALGDFDISNATQAVRTLMAIFNKDVNEASLTLAKFNLVENRTAISAGDMAEALPEVANSAKQFGLTAEETIQILAAMYQKGIAATEAAHALKFSIASLFKPTKQTIDQLEEIGKVAPDVANGFLTVLNGSVKGKRGLEQLALAYEQLEQTFGSQTASELLSNLVGKRQANRMLALFGSMQDAAKGLINDYVRAGEAVEDNEAAVKALNKEMKALRESDAFRMDQAKADFKAFLAEVGQLLMPIVLDWFEKLNDLGQKFLSYLKDNPAIQKLIVGFGALLAAIGPVVYVSGQLFTAWSTIMHTAGKLIPDLSRVQKAFMNAAEAGRYMRGEMVDIGPIALDFKGKWRKMIEQIKIGIQSFFGFKTASTTSALAANASTESMVVELRRLAIEAARTGDIYQAAMMQMAASALGAETTIAGADVATDVARGVSSPGTTGAVAAGVAGAATQLDLLKYLKKIQNVPGWFGKKFYSPEKELGTVVTGLFRHGFPLKTTETLTQGSLFEKGVDTISVGALNARELAKWTKMAGEKAAEAGTKYKGLGKILAFLMAPLARLTHFLGFGGGAAAAAAPAAAPSVGGGMSAGGIAAIVAAIYAAIPAIAALSGKWKSFWKGASGVLDSAKNIILSALGNIKNAFIVVKDTVLESLAPFKYFINEIAKIVGDGSKKRGWERIGDAWARVAQALAVVAKILGVILEVVAWIIKAAVKVEAFLLKWYVIKPLIAIFKIVWKVLQGIVHVAKKIVNIFKEIVGAGKKVADIVGAVLDGFGALDVAKGVAGTIGGWLGIGGDSADESAKKVYTLRDAINEAAAASAKFGQWWNQAYAKTFNKLVEEGNLSKANAMWDKIIAIAKKKWAKLDKVQKNKTTFWDFVIRISKKNKFNIADFFDMKAEKLLQKRMELIASKPAEFIQGEMITNPLKDAMVKQLAALRSALDSAIGKMRDQVMKNFEKMATARLKVFDDQIKAIEDQEKAERELYETQEYLNNRRKMLDDYAITAENYKRNRALAIYEGRYDDARNLDLQFQADTKSHNNSLADIDEQRNRELIQKERDLQKARIEEQKKGMEEQLAIQRENLENQLALITEYTPKNVSELANMIDNMNALLAGTGAETMGNAMAIATGMWGEAVEAAGKKVGEEAYWAGEWIADMVQGGMEKNSAYIEWEQNLEKLDREMGSKFAKLQRWRKGGSTVAGEIVRSMNRESLRRQGYGGINIFTGQLYDLDGNPIRRHKGGPVGGGAPRDVPATLQTGEYVIQRSAAQKLGLGFLNKINKYHEGGSIGESFQLVAEANLLSQIYDFFKVPGAMLGGYTWESLVMKYLPTTLLAGGGTGIMPVVGGGILANASGYMVDWLQNFLKAAFPDMAENIGRGSKYRPHGRSTSFHFTGQALDIPSNPGNRIDRLNDIFNYLAGNLERLSIIELIWQNRIFHPWDGWNRYRASDHFDHVHVAVGSYKEGFIPFARGGKVLVDNLPALLHKGEVVLPANIVKNIEQSNGGGDTYIVVENFIGQRQWFEQMMKEYNVKTLPSEQRKRGTINRVVSSRKDNSVRYV